MICEKHARWQGDYYLCYKCERLGKKSDIRIELPAEPQEEVTLSDDTTSLGLGSLYFTDDIDTSSNWHRLDYNCSI